MPGNANSGRRPAQIDQRRRLAADDVPQRPEGLQGPSLAYWLDVVDQCEHLTRQDTTLAAEACRLFALYSGAVAECESDPLNGDKVTITRKYFDQWQHLVKKLGLDPPGRAKFSKLVTRGEPDQNEMSPERRFFGTVG